MMEQTLTAKHSLVMKADRERVWKAITTPQHFSTWFEMKVSLDRLEVGGKMRFVEEKDAEPCVIMTVEPPERFAFNWQAEPGLPVMTLVTFVLEAVEEGTRVTVTEEGFEALPEKYRKARSADNSEGWQTQLRNLDKFLKEGKDSGAD